MRHLLAVQSQDYPGAKWGLAQRVEAATDADIDRLYDAGAILRTHVLRPTWHFVAPEDLRWLQSLTAPRVHAASAYRYRQLEIDGKVAARAAAVFARTLEGGRAATRVELRAALEQAGIEAPGQRLAYLVSYSELEAVLCSGPRRGRSHTYALVDERVPPSPPREREEALAELARRYLTGHGPAQDIDLAWWSGLTVREARRALAAAGPALTRREVGDRTFWAAADARSDARGDLPPRRGPLVQLLPNFDELLVAFRDRTDALDPGLPPWARKPEVVLSHTIVRDGLVVGRWRRRESPGATVVSVEPAVPLTPPDRSALRRSTDRLERFLGRSVEARGLD